MTWSMYKDKGLLYPAGICALFQLSTSEAMGPVTHYFPLVTQSFLPTGSVSFSLGNPLQDVHVLST